MAANQQDQAFPERFGQYILLRKIAIGGMAEIFKAKPASPGAFDRELVIKRILPSYSSDEDFVKMFIDEAAITSKLQHGNIVQIFDFDVVNGAYFIAMELIEGLDLKNIIDDGARDPKFRLSIPQIVELTIALSQGLHYAHTKDYQGQPLNIVHRDVSPHNVMISYNGDVKLMDFGIAKAAQRSTKTQAGTVKGKVAYMSPEQARGRSLDGRSDLFALGVMLWEMLTQKRLFLADSDFQTLTNVLKTEAPPPSSINPAVPKDLDRIVLKSLEKDRDQRYANVELMGRDLMRWYHTHVKNMEQVSLRRFMQETYRDNIRALAETNAIDQAVANQIARTPGAAGPPNLPPPAPSSPPPSPSMAEDRTIAMPIEGRPLMDEQTIAMQVDTHAGHAGIDHGAPTLMDDSISQSEIRAQIDAALAKATRNLPGGGITAGHTSSTALAAFIDEEEAKSSRTRLWMILAIAILFAGAGAFFFFAADSGLDGTDSVASAEHDGALILKVTPSSAKVTVAGNPAGELTEGLEIGKRVKVIVEAPGYQRYEDFIAISEPEVRHEVVLEPEREKVSVVIEAGGDPKADIAINGEPFATGVKMYEGVKDETIIITVTPSDGSPAITRRVLIDGSEPIITITAEAGPAVLKLTVIPADAQISIDDVDIFGPDAHGNATVEGASIGDTLEITVSREGFESKTEQITLESAEDSLEIRLAN